MSQWYLHFDDKRHGPFEQEEAYLLARRKPTAHAWRQGYAGWIPVSKIAELRSSNEEEPPIPAFKRQSIADEIDYTIEGSEMQYVEIELDPGESAIAEAGAMMYKNPNINMTAIFGDGTGQDSGIMSKVLGAGKRVLTGESLFMTLFTNNSGSKAHAAFGAPYPGNIIPIKLDQIGGSIICQKDSFLCAAKGVSINLYFQKKILTGLFGGEGFIMQKLEGDGWAFLHAGGTITEKQLAAGEELHVDTGCIVAFEPSIDFDLEKAGNLKSIIFGNEGVFFAKLRGPGKIWLQSLPFSRLAGRISSAMPQKGGSKGEGSVLGGIGNILDGDN